MSGTTGLRERRTTRATTLTEALDVFDPAPLRKKAYDNFYYRTAFELRGSNVVKRFQTQLMSRKGSEAPYQAFLVGTSGCGKSTEMETLRRAVEGSFATLVVSAREDLDVTEFEAFDFLFVLATRIAEETHGLAGRTADGSLLEDLQGWGSEITEVSLKDTSAAMEAETGVGAETPSLLASIFRAFARFRASLKTTSSRQVQTKLYNRKRIPDLTALVNRILDECNDILRAQDQARPREWLVIAEDFDKADVDPQSLQTLFSQYGNALSSLRVHMIFNVPRYILDEPNVPRFSREAMTDIAVFDKARSVDHRVVAALKAAVGQRIDPGLIDDGALEAAIVSSGGLFSTLFSLLFDAVLNALESDRDRIEPPDVKRAIAKARSQFRSRLSPSPLESPAISVEAKVRALRTAYRHGPTDYAPDTTGQRLITLQLILTHNESYWYSVHPLAVDYLAISEADEFAEGGSLPDYR